MYILLGSVVIDILLTLTGQCSHTMLIIGTSPLYIDQTWLGVRCHPEWDWGQNQPVDQINTVALLKYGQKCT